MNGGAGYSPALVILKCSLCWGKRGRLMKRVVVTGLGMVTPLACGVEATWRRLVAGESGVAKIQGFDVSDIACQIAAQTPRGDGEDAFRPDEWMDPKEQRKVDDFIV